MKLRFLILGIFISVLAGCQSQTSSVRTVTADFRKLEGVYVIAYTADQTIRERMEQQLTEDLSAQDMIAFASYHDVPDITASTPADVIAEANSKKLLGLLVINQVAADASDSIVKNPRRISPTHPTLQEFYSYTRERMATIYSEDREVFAEVNLFVLDRGEAKLFWSGTTWSFQADRKGTAIREISETIANQLAQVRARYR